jgi:hypothetical protein
MVAWLCLIAEFLAPTKLKVEILMQSSTLKPVDLSPTLSLAPTKSKVFTAKVAALSRTSGKLYLSSVAVALRILPKLELFPY